MAKTRNEEAYKRFLELCSNIKANTGTPVGESTLAQNKRKDRLLKNFPDFCKYYFPHYMSSDFGWFHKKAAKAIISNPNCNVVLEWPREHAKSIFAGPMMTLYLKALGELTGMVMVSATKEKAELLLADIQAELEANERYTYDFGEQVVHGEWRQDYFATKDGIGFWAVGIGGKARGIRKVANRPNLAIIDDSDDDVMVHNIDRVKKCGTWLNTALYFALQTKGARRIFCGNRIHPKSILAHYVGDIEEGDPINESITDHIKVYALEDANHNCALPGTAGARPAWKENYTMDVLLAKIKGAGPLAALREFFHKYIPEGTIFKEEWFGFTRPLPYREYESIEVYCDPSYKETEKSDFKAIVAVGKKGTEFHVLDVWAMQGFGSMSGMVRAFYDMWGKFGKNARYWMETNMLQDLILKEFDRLAKKYKGNLPLRKDNTPKDNKGMRIESLTLLFANGDILFSDNLRTSKYLKTLKDQLMSFPEGHDDVPDALEGAITKAELALRPAAVRPRSGKFKRNKNR